GGNAVIESDCDIWCNTHPNECHETRMKFCTEGDNIVSDKCRNWEDVAKTAGKDVSSYINAKFQWATRGPSRMRSQQVISWANDPKIVDLSRSTKDKYDLWWRDYC